MSEVLTQKTIKDTLIKDYFNKINKSGQEKAKTITLNDIKRLFFDAYELSDAEKGKLR